MMRMTRPTILASSAIIVLKQQNREQIKHFREERLAVAINQL